MQMQGSEAVWKLVLDAHLHCVYPGEAPQSVSTPFVWVALLLRYWDWYDGTGILAPAVCRLLSVRRTDAVKWCEM